MKKLLLFLLITLSIPVFSGEKSSSIKVTAQAGTFDASKYCFYAHEVYSLGSIMKQEGKKMVCALPVEEKKGRIASWQPLEK